MLWTLFVSLLFAWCVGIVTSVTLSGLIHLLQPITFGKHDFPIVHNSNTHTGYFKCPDYFVDVCINIRRKVSLGLGMKECRGEKK